MNVTVDESQRQLVLLALAKLSLERPGFEWALGEVARAFNGVTMYNQFKELHTPVKFEIPEASITLTLQEFRMLDEYSMTMPTGTRIGKRWRRLVEHEGAAVWLMGEYAAAANRKEDVGIIVKWYRVVLSDPREMVKLTRQVRRDFFCSCGAACSEEEYKKHVEMGHDQGETLYNGGDTR